MAGFGLGFLAFALKKLLLPVLIGAQIAKSILIAMFLPSLLGGLGKVLNRGVSTFASASSASGSNGGGAGGAANLEDFEFKDNLDAAESSYPSGTFAYPETPGVLPASAIYKDQSAVSSFRPTAAPKLGMGLGNYYGSRPAVLGPGVKSPRPHDFKVFHQIPKSSLLLSHYDPFYSPLLSRLDSVFKQLGSDSEPCREQLVCEMYSSPARFAPYSNLVSAQLSRELNELRKPSTDNSEILRFFRYMKAAKDGQDGLPCAQLHPGCSASASRPPLLQTFHDINKLVHARRLGRLLTADSPETESQPTEVGEYVTAEATAPLPTVADNIPNPTAETEHGS
ncbi:uncharacterized protein LOC124607130 [Schistocerca americana]|uniref:uncharacterized protein LOC124607130 n=1 Tax=Schistocerca americana TaxID=7009 RepID=UPI001F50270B|nr:uncharacterized protein LOC124607130 [Schistocerca americana]XP_049957231.1 uncharacterized protein LOC126473919 [Schistocerca serialis cubense]